MRTVQYLLDQIYSVSEQNPVLPSPLGRMSTIAFSFGQESAWKDRQAIFEVHDHRDDSMERILVIQQWLACHLLQGYDVLRQRDATN